MVPDLDVTDVKPVLDLDVTDIKPVLDLDVTDVKPVSDLDVTDVKPVPDLDSPSSGCDRLIPKNKKNNYVQLFSFFTLIANMNTKCQLPG